MPGPKKTFCRREVFIFLLFAAIWRRFERSLLRPSCGRPPSRRGTIQKTWKYFFCPLFDISSKYRWLFFLASSLVLAPTWAGGSVPLEKASYQSAFLVFLCPMPFIIISSTATQWVGAIRLIAFNSELIWSVYIHYSSRAIASLVALGYQDRLSLGSWSYRLAASPFFV